MVWVALNTDTKLSHLVLGSLEIQGMLCNGEIYVCIFSIYIKRETVARGHALLVCTGQVIAALTFHTYWRILELVVMSLVE